MTFWETVLCLILAYLYGFSPWARLANKDGHFAIFILRIICGVIAAFYIFYGARYMII